MRRRPGAVRHRLLLRAWGVTLLRLAFVLVALHIGRMTHAISDVLEGFDLVAASTDCDSGSGDDDGDCPPGCPNCHCVHSGYAPLPPRTIASFVPQVPRDTTLHEVSYEAHVPCAPALDSPFRPPRATHIA